ncbi:hypothetical protein A2165_03065 [Candidatus Curtissbacteria bacterium RBG_13_40_7]|uniref:Uncharacterized protein n=1 Tax=Candidatus Curtissbacteria bacterium RBG_13_40_7 TaxID=1797706 RepID=A0A1F5FVJ2_9BACT|nr:MAG: hypothetical protein A2165_03065 [Candidatus Curtissbacteria bacterium RBG_13_40_7]
MSERLGPEIVKSVKEGFVSQGLLDLVPPETGEHVQMAGIEGVFDSYTPQLQLEFRNGLAEAMGGWKESMLDPNTYERLVYLAGHTKTFQAMPLIIATVETRNLDLENKDAKGVMRACIGTFMYLSKALDKEWQQSAVDVMRSWFSDDYLEKYAGSLMNTICSIKPNEFPRLFPRFLEIDQRNPGYFSRDDCIREAIRVVTPEKMLDLIDQLPANTRSLVGERLARMPARLVENHPID